MVQLLIKSNRHTAVGNMVRGSRSISISILKKLLICIIAIQLLVGTTLGKGDYKELRQYVSDPSQSPFFENFTTPTIQPGTTDKVTFELENRYELKKMYEYIEDINISNVTLEMSDVTLEIEIYRYVTLETSKNVEDLDQTPKITGGNANLQSTPNQYTAVYYWDSIQDKEVVQIELSIKSYSGSPQGTYFVRMHLNFSFNGAYFDMKSRGHFTQTQWDRATENITGQEFDEVPGKFIVGRLDLNILNVDGLITDTSFRVKEPIPLWPLFVLVGLAVLCLLLAVMFYNMDERGKFPKMKKRLDGYNEKIRKFRYREK